MTQTSISLPKQKVYSLDYFKPIPEGYPISAKVVLDSINTFGHRLTTLEIIYPRYLLPEVNTHRVFSRNTSSSRAIPFNKQLDLLANKIVEPIRYGKNRPGMQAAPENIRGEDLETARRIWREMAEFNMQGCLKLHKLGLHKQWVSRPLEWIMTTRMLVSSTEWDNFFLLRDHEDAQDEMRILAQTIKIALNNSTPTLKDFGEWHIPYVTDKDIKTLDLYNLIKVSVARCARVSYKTNQGNISSIEEDLALFNKLSRGFQENGNQTDPLHASPFEHQALPVTFEDEVTFSNFVGWIQARKFLESGCFTREKLNPNPDD